MDVHYVLAVDVEATGPSMTHHFMPCFGTALVHVASQRVVASHIAWLPQPPRTTWDEATMLDFWSLHPSAHRAVCTRLREFACAASAQVADASGDGGEDDDGDADVAALHERVVERTLRAAMRDWVAWCRATVREHVGAHECVRIASDNAAFDGAWLSAYMARYGDTDAPDDNNDDDEEQQQQQQQQQAPAPCHSLQQLLGTETFASVLDTTALAHGVSLAHAKAPWRPRRRRSSGDDDDDDDTHGADGRCATPPTTAHTVYAALGVSERREQLLAELGVRPDHNPENDAIVVGVQVALVLNALDERVRTQRAQGGAAAAAAPPTPSSPPLSHYVDAQTRDRGVFVNGTWFPHAAVWRSATK